MKCDLCHEEFNRETAQADCRGCGFGPGCQSVRCPKCHYEAVPQVTWPRWLRWLTGRNSPEAGHCCSGSEHPEVMSLCLVPLHAKAEVVSIEKENREQMRKLLAMGILPGTAISVIQKFPSCVVEIGYSRFCMDKELSDCVQVALGRNIA